MHILKNRITVSLIIILLGTFFWEFYVKPVSGPLYTAAVAEYKNQQYQRSMELLQSAYRIDANDTAILRLFGWNYLKLGKPQEAMPYFARALRLNPRLDDARLGLGYCYLEFEDGQKALDTLNQIQEPQRSSNDSRVAFAAAYQILGDNRRAISILKQVLQDDPKNLMASRNLAVLTGVGTLEELSSLQPVSYTRPATLMVAARLREGSFEVPQANNWKKLFVAGVNITPAIPGHFASDPPTETDIYQKWLEQIGALGANSVRAYTILPPAFYNALLRYNAQHAQSPIYLFQGIWAADPPGENLYFKEYRDDFQRGLRDAVDVVHGQTSIPIRPGSIGGVFTADISPFVLGWLVGRDLEPHIALATNYRNSGVNSFAGRYLGITNGNPTEVWLTQQCDAVIQYEVEKYNWQRPVAFVNWAPLDPLNHPTESRMEQEIEIRTKLGERNIPLLPVHVDDDDAVSVDPTKVKPAADFTAGFFAAYSVFPYYPDFMNLDPQYVQGRDSQGPSSFISYLESLRRYHKDMPLLVGEFGLPSSLGISHFNPLGWNDGGLTEEQQGNYLARMIHDIFETGCAGGLMEGWLDEWYRQNWLVRDFEVPGARTRLWLNTLSPEANSGLLGFKPSHGETYLLRGDPSNWKTAQLFYQKAAGAPVVRNFGDRFDPARHVLRLFVDSDEAYLYMRVDVEKLDNDGDGKPDWNEANYLITLGTTPKPTGSVLLPFVSNVRVPSGVDFVIRLGKPNESKILVASDYNPYKVVPVPGLAGQTQVRYRIPFLPGLREDSQFDEMTVEPNRRRYGRDGHMYPPVRYSRSSLQWGTLEKGSPDYNSLAEWYANSKANTIELRIPWGLLQVTDPSSLQVLAGIDRSGTFYSEATKGLQLGVVSFRPQTQELADVLPRFRSPGVIAEQDMKRYTWAPWESVTAKPYLKDSYSVVQRALQDLRSPRRGERTRAVAQKGSKKP